KTGPVKIVWQDQGIGIKDALVLLQWFDDNCCQPGVGVSPPPGTCNVFCNDDTTQCMAIDYIDPDGTPGTIYVKRVVLGDVGVCTFTAFAMHGRFMVAGLLTDAPTNAGFRSKVEFYIWDTLVNGWRLVSSAGGTTCTPPIWSPPADWPQPNPNDTAGPLR